MKIHSLLDNLPTFTSLTLSSLSKDVSHSFARITILLRLSIHSRSDLNHLDNSPLTFALSTLLDILSSFSFTNITHPGSLMEQRHLPSFVEHLQRNFNLFLHWLHLLLLLSSLWSLTLAIHHLKYFFFPVPTAYHTVSFAWDLLGFKRLS